MRRAPASFARATRGAADGRALDVDTGKVLWEHELDAALEGMPAVYEVDGREYVVFCAAAGSKPNPPAGEKIRGAYVAFALPKP